MSEAERAVHRVSPWRLGLEAARRNALPGVCLALFAVAIGLSYAYVPAVREAMGRFAEWRQALAFPLNWVFPVVSTALFAGVIPWCVQRARQGAAGADGRSLVFFVAFWGYKGVEINLLYVVLSAIFGDSDAPRVVLAKIAVDMGFYCPAWAVTTTLLAYQFKDAGYTWAGLRDGPLRRGWRSWWRWDALPITVNNWAVWIPAVAVIYTLPLPLQLPVQNLVLCFWCLALLFMTDNLNQANRTKPVAP